MSSTLDLPDEIAELFSLADGEGLVTERDLEEAGFERIADPVGDFQEYELWMKGGTSLDYDPEENLILDYNTRN